MPSERTGEEAHSFKTGKCSTTIEECKYTYSIDEKKVVIEGTLGMNFTMRTDQPWMYYHQTIETLLISKDISL